MNLLQLLATSPGLETLRGLALILSPELHATLEETQAQLPDRMFVVKALPLTDGRFLLSADLLSEASHGGIYADGFGHLPVNVFPLVAVVPIAEAIALLPLSTEE